MNNQANSRRVEVWNGCDHGIACGHNPLCFTPHPWCPTGNTCMFSSAFMRAGHPAKLAAYSVMGEPAYLETTEIMLKEALFKSGQSKA